MKAALYARVSTVDKDQNPQIQLKALKDYCQAMDWQIFAEYTDTARAADLEHRTAWLRLMKDASLRKFDILLIWKLDRAFRSLIHAKNTIEMLKKYGIHFRSLGDPGIDTNTPNGELLFNILASFAQYESDLIAQRVNAGMDYAREHGTKSGIPIGRPAHQIPFINICKAIILSAKDGKVNYSESARLLAKEFQIKDLTPGFVWLRLKRRADEKGLTRTEMVRKILEGGNYADL